MAQANLKGFFYGVIVTGGMFAVALLFATQGREEVKVEQKIQRVEKRIDDKRFDAEFDQRWNGNKPAAKNSDTTADEMELADLKSQQKQLEADNSQSAADFRDAMSEAGGNAPGEVKTKAKQDLEKALAKGSKPQ